MQLEQYPVKIQTRWHQNWDAIVPIFKFSTTVRKVIYTTNAIESLNATYRKLNRQRRVFPSDTALLKALYLSTFEATKKWTMPIWNWGQVYGGRRKRRSKNESVLIVFSPAIIIEELLLQRFLHTLGPSAGISQSILF